MEIDILLEYSDRTQLRQWLEENHTSAHHCWVATYRGKTPMPNALSYLLHILLKIAAMAGGEPLYGASLLGGRLSGQNPYAQRTALPRCCRGMSLFWLDRFYAQAAPRRTTGTTHLSKKEEQPLDRTKPRPGPRPRATRTDDISRDTSRCLEQKQLKSTIP